MNDTKKNHSSSTTLTNWRRKISCYEFSVLEFLAVKFDFFYKILLHWRTSVFRNEIAMARITNQDKVLHVGCGTLPSASIMIAEEIHAKVVGIDNNRTAVKLAQHYIKKKGLGDRITIEYGDGTTYPVEEYDVIFIAINVWPIDGVLRHIASHAKPGVRILCKDVKDDILPLVENKEFRDFFLVTARLQNPRTQSFLLTKIK